MENQETKKELSIVELKKQHWKSIKKEFIEKIPKQFKVDVKDLESNSSKYYHPIIVLNEDYIIHAQSYPDNVCCVHVASSSVKSKCEHFFI